jgi:hypothetical protein
MQLFDAMKDILDLHQTDPIPDARHPDLDRNIVTILHALLQMYSEESQLGLWLCRSLAPFQHNIPIDVRQ